MNKLESGNKIGATNTIKSVKSAGKTSGVVNVEQVKDGINKSITEQVHAALKMNNQTNDNRCTDTYVTVAPRSER